MVQGAERPGGLKVVESCLGLKSVWLWSSEVAESGALAPLSHFISLTYTTCRFLSPIFLWLRCPGLRCPHSFQRLTSFYGYDSSIWIYFYCPQVKQHINPAKIARCFAISLWQGSLSHETFEQQTRYLKHNFCDTISLINERSVTLINLSINPVVCRNCSLMLMFFRINTSEIVSIGSQVGMVCCGMTGTTILNDLYKTIPPLWALIYWIQELRVTNSVRQYGYPSCALCMIGSPHRSCFSLAQWFFYWLMHLWKCGLLGGIRYLSNMCTM